MNIASKKGFTLMELILVVVVMTTVLASINAFLFSALHMRRRVTESVDRAMSQQRALGVIRRDLACAVPPSGLLSGSFRIGNISDSGLNMNVVIEICTTTGSARYDEPWGDIQKVSYGLVDQTGNEGGVGKSLVRSVTRNLLNPVISETEDQWLMGDVERVSCECFDGVQWYDAWDTTMNNTNLPSAVRINVQFAGEETEKQSVELVVPIVSQSIVTNQMQTAEDVNI